MKHQPLHNNQPIPRDLLIWYDQNKRTLPWRTPHPGTPNPYHVWLSEIMLQQTVVKTVIPYFDKFTKRWPTIKDLANASLDEVRANWAGLGYYSRARNLHNAAKMMVDDFAGKVPTNEKDLLKLPGVGPYTAGAILTIAFDKKAAPVDGNIERVLARAFALITPLPKLKQPVKARLEKILPSQRRGCFIQALMDLGARICAPKKPKCGDCPLAAHCKAKHKNIAESLPVKPPKEQRSTRYGACFYIENKNGEVLFQKRAESGVLAGMMELPSTDFMLKKPTRTVLLKQAPFNTNTKWQRKKDPVVHVFTHFRLELSVFQLKAEESQLPLNLKSNHQFWAGPDDFENLALPSLFQKALKAARS